MRNKILILSVVLLSGCMPRINMSDVDNYTRNIQAEELNISITPQGAVINAKNWNSHVQALGN